MRACFVCMPLIDEFKDIFTAIADQVKESLGSEWKCLKADDTRRPGMVDEKIAHDLLNAELVIAVAPDPRRANSANPNVMYELGVAHSFRKPTIVVADSKNQLPFDIKSVEAIELDFSRFEEKSTRVEFISNLRSKLEHALPTSEILAGFEGRYIPPPNPITTHLSGTQIFIEDLPWLWGYCRVLEEERKAETVWEITKDLFWPTEPLFFDSIKAAIHEEKKHYFIIPHEKEALSNVARIKNQLRIQPGLDADKIDKFLRFVAIDPNNFRLWPISIVLYDANFATRRRGIICEPMTSEVGHDLVDKEFQALLSKHAVGGVDALQRHLTELSWLQRRREATFDISLDGRIVESLANAFADIWDAKILEEAMKKTGDEQANLLRRWLIRRESE